MALISRGITLSLKGGLEQIDMSKYEVLTNLQEIPELGGEAEALEITTLADVAHMYTNGILDYGDSLAFTFLYEKEQYNALQGLAIVPNTEYSWKVSLPDGTACDFNGTMSVKLAGVGVNAVLTYTVAVKPTSAMLWTGGEA